jgi:hypothetical protein
VSRKAAAGVVYNSQEVLSRHNEGKRWAGTDVLMPRRDTSRCCLTDRKRIYRFGAKCLRCGALHDPEDVDLSELKCLCCQHLQMLVPLSDRAELTKHSFMKCIRCGRVETPSELVEKHMSCESCQGAGAQTGIMC